MCAEVGLSFVTDDESLTTFAPDPRHTTNLGLVPDQIGARAGALRTLS